jgi:glycerophosphoryl diester phosphodiesterase
MTGKRILVTLHSGGLSTRPNSLDYLEKALLAAPDIVELDIRRTRDKVVLCHDPYLEADGKKILLADHGFRDLKDAEPRLLSLEEGLTFGRLHGLRFNLDLKEVGAAIPMLDLLREEDSQRGHIVTGCRLDEVKTLGAHTGDFRILLNIESAPPDLEEYGPYMRNLVKEASDLGCFGLNVDFRLCRPELFELCHDQGLPVVVWTVDEEEAMRRMVKLGADSITTHEPERLRRVIAEVL